jgi:hypothetical protein
VNGILHCTLGKMQAIKCHDKLFHNRFFSGG